MQLKPAVFTSQMADLYRLDVSLFERLLIRGVRPEMLNVQHRMRPAMARLISPSIYPDLLSGPDSIPIMANRCVKSWSISTKKFA